MTVYDVILRRSQSWMRSGRGLRDSDYRHTELYLLTSAVQDALKATPEMCRLLFEIENMEGRP